MKTFDDCIQKSEELERLGIRVNSREIAKLHNIWTPGEERYIKEVKRVNSISTLWEMWGHISLSETQHFERKVDIILLRILELATTQEERHKVYRVTPIGSEVHRVVVRQLCKG